LSAREDICDDFCLFKIQTSKLSKRFHRNERNIVFRLKLPEARCGRIHIHDKAPSNSRDVAGKDSSSSRENKECFLQKPYSSPVLLQTVRQCLDEDSNKASGG
jgi:hypothetical protein